MSGLGWSEYGGDDPSKPPDWICPGCGNSAFHWRKNCNKCGAPKPGMIKGPKATQQCDSTCEERGCQNDRIYITGLAPSVTEDDLRQLFSGIGVIGKVKQKRGYKEDWPWAIRVYTDQQGKPKGDAALTYEDPSAAHAAGSFFDGHTLKGSKLKVQMATIKGIPYGAPPPAAAAAGGGGRDGDRYGDRHSAPGGGYGDGRRDGGGGGGGGGGCGPGGGYGGGYRDDRGGYRGAPYGGERDRDRDRYGPGPERGGGGYRGNDRHRPY